MAFRAVTFPVTLARDIDSIILGARTAVADSLRAEARRNVAGATDAGIDAFSQAQSAHFKWMRAKAASRFLRGFPDALVRWCFRVEVEAMQARNDAAATFPEAPAGTVASYGARWLSPLANGMFMVSAGGVRGVSEGPVTGITMHEVYEVRLITGRNLDGETAYSVQVVMSDQPAAREEEPDPVDADPVDPEMQPEDQ